MPLAILKYTGWAHTTQHFLSQNISSAEVEKPDLTNYIVTSNNVKEAELRHEEKQIPGDII